jgi:hypothetical protein
MSYGQSSEVKDENGLKWLQHKERLKSDCEGINQTNGGGVLKCKGTVSGANYWNILVLRRAPLKYLRVPS